MTKLTRTFIKPAFSLTLFGREIAIVSLDPRKKWTYTEAKGYLLQTRTRHSGVWASQHSYGRRCEARLQRSWGQGSCV